MAREMGAVMTGVIMAGRTGAAFAANIGTMQVNEEIDALQTLGVSPMDYLVLPRIAAMVLMMPLLCIYADAMGILGGMLVGVGAFDIAYAQYLDRTISALTLAHIGIGVFKGVIFGGIVAFCGCMQGMRCGRSASAVGNATTSAVVIAIVYIVVADGLFAVLTNIIGI
jgi:phospholipid/cholesterol/gamma-HCH transport system permease protein